MTQADTGPNPTLGVFLSGTGRTLVNLCHAIDDGRLRARIAIVVASRECPGADRARQRGIPVRVLGGDLDAQTLEPILADAGVAWIVLAGYLRMLPSMPRYEGRVVNIHPALLPRFGGQGMYGMRVHRAVLDANERETGCTVHLCNDRYDEGPILAQATCPVRPDDTPESLAARVFALECDLLPRTLDALLHGQEVPA